MTTTSTSKLERFKNSLLQLLSSSGTNLGPQREFAIRYYLQLAKQHFSESPKPKPHITLHGEKLAADGTEPVYPLHELKGDLASQVPLVSYEDLKKQETKFKRFAAQAVLWFQPLQAGSGSSIKRLKYLAFLRRTTEAKVKTGSKGTDLEIELPMPKAARGSEAVPPTRVSLAELQWLKMLKAINRGEYSKVWVQDLVGPETQTAVTALWQKPCPLNPNRTYGEYSEQFGKFDETFQPALPCLDQNSEPSQNRLAPPGHAFFAVKLLTDIFLGEGLPTESNIIAGISNGEDMASNIDPVIAGWMISEHIPIVLVTTDKTAIDTKGGILGATLNEAGNAVSSLRVIETAQAQESGQKELFESMPGLCSTNLSLFNLDVLKEELKKLSSGISAETSVEDLLAPDLIRNLKTQKDTDGTERTYLQLEGAMGSTLMNLDAYWRKNFNKPLVHIVRVEAKNRSLFFTPIKTAFDYWLLCHSDRFKLDPETLRYMDTTDRLPPRITFASDSGHYQEVMHVLEAFNDTSVKELDTLWVEGKVSFAGVRLKGNITVTSKQTRLVSLAQNGIVDLENQKVGF